MPETDMTGNHVAGHVPQHRALEDVCRDGPRTRDVGGTASTSEVGDAVAARIADA